MIKFKLFKKAEKAEHWKKVRNNILDYNRYKGNQASLTVV